MNFKKSLREVIRKTWSKSSFILRDQAIFVVLFIILSISIAFFVRYAKVPNPFVEICTNLYQAGLIDNIHGCASNPEHLEDFDRMEKIFIIGISNKDYVISGMSSFELEYEIHYECTNQGQTCLSKLDYIFKKRPFILWDVIVGFRFENDILIDIRWRD